MNGYEDFLLVPAAVVRPLQDGSLLRERADLELQLALQKRVALALARDWCQVAAGVCLRDVVGCDSLHAWAEEERKRTAGKE